MDNEEYEELRRYLMKKEKATEEYRNWADQFREENGQIFFGDKRLIPRREVARIISIFHDNMAHQSDKAILHHLKKRYVWQSQHKDVREYVKTCWECQQRGNQKQNNAKQTIPVNDIFDRWGIDVVGPLPLSYQGNKYIVVAVDYFTCWPEARLLKVANATTIADFIYKEIICRFETPKVIQSDQGTHFVNKVVKELTAKFRIKHNLSSPYHLQSNGLVKRFNRTLCEGIVKMSKSIRDWNEYIQPILFAYRIKPLRISKQTPYMLMYGREPKLAMNKPSKAKTLVERLLEIMEKVLQLRGSARKTIKEAQDKLNQAFGSYKQIFAKGDLVLYFDKTAAGRHDMKLENKWKGPYQISHVLDKGEYKISINGKELKTTVNGNLLKRFHSRSTWELLILI